MPTTIYGLSGMHIELTNRCNKNCWMCACRQLERENNNLAFTPIDTDFSLLEKLASEFPPYVVTQLHNRGEPLLYDRFGDAARLFKKNRNIVNVVTNGKLLLEKSDEIFDNVDTLDVSIFEKDVESEEQYDIIVRFLERKKSRRPFVIFRIIGDVAEERFEKLDGLIVRRQLRLPSKKFDYRFKVERSVIPEIGICLDFMSHPVMNSEGDISICAHVDPKRLGIIGNLRKQTLSEIWNGSPRIEWLQKHIDGKRAEVPLCAACNYWGVPSF